MLQDIRWVHKNQLYFCALAMNIQNMRLRKELHLQYLGLDITKKNTKFVLWKPQKLFKDTKDVNKWKNILFKDHKII